MFATTLSAHEQLQATIQGAVILPDSDQYAAARRAWNLTVDQHPALIVLATCVHEREDRRAREEACDAFEHTFATPHAGEPVVHERDAHRQSSRRQEREPHASPASIQSG